jgi:hypothetical protein
VRNRKRALFSMSVFEPLAKPVFFLVALLLVLNGGYCEIRNQRRCDEIAARRGYRQARLYPGGRASSIQCLCRGKQRADGTWDMTVTEVVSVYDEP